MGDRVNNPESWSARQYSKFENERNRPITDLLNHVYNEKVNSAIDLGCGPGNSTELLYRKFPDAKITGIDSAVDMIENARKRLPELQFEVADISTWQDDKKHDIILANASLQWVPDHEKLFPSLISGLNPGGTLAVQMPDNFNEPAHQLMRVTANEGSWADKLQSASKRIAREDPGWYYQKIKGLVAKLDIWRTTYYHPLSGGSSAVVEWFKGTGLRPFLDPLDEIEKALFLEKYSAGIAKAYPEDQEGNVLLPFPRLFIIATR